MGRGKFLDCCQGRDMKLLLHIVSITKQMHTPKDTHQNKNKQKEARQPPPPQRSKHTVIEMAVHQEQAYIQTVRTCVYTIQEEPIVSFFAPSKSCALPTIIHFDGVFITHLLLLGRNGSLYQSSNLSILFHWKSMSWWKRNVVHVIVEDTKERSL